MPGPAYVTVQPFRDVIDPAMRSWQIGATIFVAFGVLALALASVGLYSVIAYEWRNAGARSACASRSERPRRASCGSWSAAVSDLPRWASRSAAAVALVAGRGIAALLFQETPTDPLVYGIVAAVLLVVTLVATAAPALSAARVDPNCRSARTE